jgi:predicted HTH transcriptional regulator
MIEIRDIVDFNDFIENLLLRDESDDLEYKSAAGGFPGSFWETYSAFANTDGGMIVLGVGEKKDRLFLDRLTDEQIEKYRKEFWNNINNRQNISCNLMKSDDLIVTDYKGFKLMIFYVPRANREQRPVFRSSHPYNGTFKRNNEGDYKCTEREVQRMFADADPTRSADSRILKNYSLDDFDATSLRQYRQLFALVKPHHPWLVLDDISLLKKLGGYRKDRETGEEGFTLAGVLMFGKGEAIIESECCPNFFPDFQEKFEPDVRWTNRICPDGTWEGNLFQFYRQVLPRLQSVLPKPFVLIDNLRRDETPAHVAVREALVNFCIHADYTEQASMTIQLYKDRFVFSNPGTLLVSKEQYYQGGESICRNKALQTMFMMLGTAEKAGSGVDKILSGWKSANWRVPEMTTRCQPDKCVLTLTMASIIDEHIESRLVSLFGKDVLYIGHDKLLVLNQACADGFVSNEGLRYVLNLHKSDIADMLKSMCHDGLLVSDGYGRGTTYHLPDANKEYVALEATEPMSAEIVAAVESNDTAKAVSRNQITIQRMSYKQLSTLILDNCEDWRTLNEIANIVGRKPKYLINKIIPRMLDSGSLEMMFVGAPKHPNQRYKKKEYLRN